MLKICGKGMMEACLDSIGTMTLAGDPEENAYQENVWFFLRKNWPINKKLVEKRTKLSFREFLMECILKMEKLPEGSILSGVGELLDEKQKVWAKINLKKDTIFLLKLMLDSEK